MRIKNKQIMSIILAAIILLGTVAPQVVQATTPEDANFMAGKMISYFGGQEIEDISTISPEELRVYAIFVSNFFKPGQTTFKELSQEDSQIRTDVEGALFQGGMGSLDKAQFTKLNELMYKSIKDGFGGSNDPYRLKDSNGVNLTGLKLKQMMVEVMRDTTASTTQKEVKNKQVIKHGSAVHLDLAEPAVRGAFKILLGYNAEFMLDPTGIEAYQHMFVDGYGNIWGSAEDVVNDDLILIMPAAINPATFSGGRVRSATRLPLNNSFGIGAALNIDETSTEFKKGATGYYNILEDVKVEAGTKNSLQIWGIASPFETIGDSTTLVSKTHNTAKALKDYYDKAYLNIDPKKTKIMLNMGATESVLTRIQASIRNTAMDAKDRGPLLYYLAGSLAIPIESVQDTMYYSMGFAKEQMSDLENNLKSLGISEQSMFTQEGDAASYGQYTRQNGVSIKIGEFMSYIGSNGLKDSFGKNSTDDATVQAYRDMGVKMAEIMGVVDGDETYIQAIRATPTGKALIEKLATETYQNQNAYVVTPGEAAVLFLAGLSNGGGYNGENIVPYALTGATIYRGIVEHGRGAAVSTLKYKEWNPTTKGWVYGMTERDAHLWLGLYHKDVVVDYAGKDHTQKLGGPLDWLYDGGLVFDDGMLPPKVAFKENANSNVFIQSHIFKAFGPHQMTAGGTPVGTAIKINGVDRVQDTKVANTSTNWPGIFLAYMDEVVDLKSVAGGGEAGTFNSSYLPAVPRVVQGRFEGMGSSSISEETPGEFDPDNIEKMQKDLLEKIYGIVSDQPNPYRDRWLKSTVDGFLITLHKTLTGSWFGDMQTVSTGSGSTYTAVAGYIHTPTLDDLPFTEWITTNYMSIYILLLLIIVGLLIIMVLTRIRTLYQGIAIFCIMAVALLLPSILITNTVNISNKMSDRIYSERFDFWALTQHQSSVNSIQSFGGTTSAETMISNTMERAEEVYSGDAGVRLKWMSPKKSDVFNSLYSQIDMSDSYATNIQIFKWLFNSFIYDSEFVKDDPLSTYLYRPYNSLATEAENYYQVGNQKLKESLDAKDDVVVKGKQPKSGLEVETITTAYKVWIDLYERALEESQNSETTSDKERLFKGGLLYDKEIYTQNNYTSIYYGDNKISDIEAVNKLRLDDATVDSIALWGTGNPDITDTLFKNPVRLTSDSTETSGIASTLTSEMDVSSLSIEEANLSAFLKNTESPYYYFYATLKHRYGEGGMGGSGGFKQALLNKDIYRVYNQELEGYDDGERGLKSTQKKINGAVRDFLDLEGLFTYTIPYLTSANDYVYEWTKLNGSSVSAFDFERKDAGGLDGDETKEYEFQKKKKEDLGRVWNMYSPWVDQLNALKTQGKVRVAGRNITVLNTLNPGAYLEKGRPMLFSEADMIAKGYTEGELSDIERRMQEVLNTTYKDLMYLVNYYDMKDEVLINAAAMYATFNFNREFSQSNVVGASTMIYPQNFEMKNFNYDAYMQLIMLNATGERINDTQDLYTRILKKSSTITGILLVVSDIIGVIIVPTLKILILLSLVFLGLLLCVVMAINPPDKIFEAVMNSLFIPAVMFMIANIVFAFTISVFVGEGLTAYVGTKGVSVSTNDPTVTLLFVGAIGAVYSVVLWKIFMKLIKSCKQYGVATLLAGAGVLSGAVVGISHKISEVTGRTINTGTTAGSARGARARVGDASVGAGEYDPYRKTPMTRSGVARGSGTGGTGVSGVAADIEHKTKIAAMGLGSYAGFKAGGAVQKQINKAKGVINKRNKGKEEVDISNIDTSKGKEKPTKVKDYKADEKTDYKEETGKEKSAGVDSNGKAYVDGKANVSDGDRIVGEDLEKEGADILKEHTGKEGRNKTSENMKRKQEVKEKDQETERQKQEEDRKRREAEKTPAFKDVESGLNHFNRASIEKLRSKEKMTQEKARKAAESQMNMFVTT